MNVLPAKVATVAEEIAERIGATTGISISDTSTARYGKLVNDGLGVQEIIDFCAKVDRLLGASSVHADLADTARSILTRLTQP